jgi:polar amino acid transport system permease protein
MGGVVDKPWLVFEYFVSPRFVWGASLTLWITIVSLFFGILVGLLIALLQESKSRYLNVVAVGYLWLFRGTPVLFQIIFVFNVLPQFGITLSNFWSGVVALAMNEGAYMAEVVRSGLQAVGRGQRTAARALGMKEWQVMRSVVLPQAMRIIIPPTGNQFIGMLKLSALTSAVAVEELLLVANQAASANFRYLEALSAAGLYYLLFTTLFMLLQARIEDWARGNRRRRGKKASLFERMIGVTGGDGGRVR